MSCSSFVTFAVISEAGPTSSPLAAATVKVYSLPIVRSSTTALSSSVFTSILLSFTAITYPSASSTASHSSSTLPLPMLVALLILGAVKGNTKSIASDTLLTLSVSFSRTSVTLKLYVPLASGVKTTDISPPSFNEFLESTSSPSASSILTTALSAPSYPISALAVTVICVPSSDKAISVTEGVATLLQS